MNLLLRTENLTKNYGLVSPNGAGKSTILKMLIGRLRPTSGEILFTEETNRKLKIGSLIEDPPLYKNLTAEENLLVLVKLFGLKKNRIKEVLHLVDLENTKKKTVAKFSLGMKQRLGIAAALIRQPDLLILDEPTNGLDPIGIKELRELIKSFPEHGITVIISSHNLTEVQQITNYVGIMHTGILKYEGVIPKDTNLEDFFLDTISLDRNGEKIT
ncbi:ATP-binding cassette domain-containing protein [Melissococcus plutonius]|uniref:Lantibiotic transport ATP-binding protein SrtF n=1 Tax=Melissococcus plutonius (strain ATCC 35311 / DSM 29964 / CIP 104052 / LMG 20360 / NCIMB 702443) TaxID=940190 RepID=F3YBQ8_MELPT|nr:ATP-binding cassette domain-containing protein [Melissococcus plutonius]AIM25907.1 lantibiotic transport ATP-binding protein SrtF [Melissococcus plutonius S1]KMT23896.1 lantibiotic transport ATP-binding protein SrtF [Melissococcus plutonius]KMT24419.1 lantibiotic transport ATP-binding protein SrtF [Melissococcus plutonius]KMT25992.1 lantibiotic transport ATP-binding protein SrtF [Melissococcus plutonius]KMT28542.1 lantibiotic transport ATP-binding protein SrtF [Melissococcus plutonius]